MVLVPIQYSLAHHDICEICEQPTDPRSYKALIFDIYIPSNITNDVRSLSYLNSVLVDINTREVSEVTENPTRKLIDKQDSLYNVRGSVIFKNNNDAQSAFTRLLTLLTVDRNSLEYSRILITDNTHHYPNPLPDVIVNSDTKGNISNLENYELRGFK